MPAILTADGITFSNATITDTRLIPAGTLISCSFTAATFTPAGYLYCNGTAVSRTVYSELFSRIGTTFGAGDGVNTFNLPDLRGEFIRGWDDGRGVDSGRGFGTVQGQQNGSHAHNAGNVNNNHFHGGNTGNVSNDHSHFFVHSNYANADKGDGPNRGNRFGTGANTGGINNNHFHGFNTGGPSSGHNHGINASGSSGRPRNRTLVYFIKF